MSSPLSGTETRAPLSMGRMRRYRRWVGALGAVVVLSGLGWVGTGSWSYAQTDGQATDSAAGGPEGSNQIPVCGKSRSTRASFNLDAASDTTLDFGQDRTERLLVLTYDVIGCRFRNSAVIDRNKIDVDVPPLLDDNGRRLDATVESEGVVIERQKIRVEVLIDPNDGPAAAGTYRSSVEIVSRIGDRSVAPLTVTVRYRNVWQLFLSVMLPALIFGTVVVWAKTVMADDQENNYRARGYFGWLGRAGNLFAVAAGLVAARVAFGESFLGDPDWGSQSLGASYLWPITSAEWWALATVMATAFTGAFTAASVPGEAVRRSKQASENQAQQQAEDAHLVLSAKDFPDSDKLTVTDNRLRSEDGPQVVDAGEALSQHPTVVYE